MLQHYWLPYQTQLSLGVGGHRKLVGLYTYSLQITSPKPHFQRYDGRMHSSRTPKSRSMLSSAPPIVSFSGRGFDMIRSVAPPKTTTGKSLRPNNMFSSPPPYHHSQSLYSQPHCVASTPPPPRSSHDLYNSKVTSTTGMFYLYHGTSNWNSHGNGSPVSGPSFHHHMMNHNPSPLITQPTPYLVQPISGSALEPNNNIAPIPGLFQSGSQPLTLPNWRHSSLDCHVPRPKKILTDSRCEEELNKNLEELTTSLANQFLLSTSPGAPISPLHLKISVTPYRPNPPLFLPRIASPNALKSQSGNSALCLPRSPTPDWLPPHCPVADYQTEELKPNALDTNGLGTSAVLSAPAQVTPLTTSVWVQPNTSHSKY